ncbi:MAG: ATP-binding protein [Trueperaceae bacterium]
MARLRQQAPKTGHTILIVDDDSTLLHTLKQLLVCEGLEVFAAKNGDEALALCQALGRQTLGQSKGPHLMQILTMRENHRLNRELQAFSNDLEQRVLEPYNATRGKPSTPCCNERLASLGRISAGLAHEINTPVAAAMNALQQAKHLAAEYEVSLDNPIVTASDHHEIAKELEQALTTTGASLERLGEFVRRMRGQLRGSGGATDFDVVNVAQDALMILEHRARYARVRLEFAPPKPFFFYGDATRLSQVVSNLVVNALAWQPTSTVTVRLEPTPQTLYLSVQDNGAGIPNDLQEKIFEPLFTTKAIGKGTGLGLAIIQDIVYGHFDGQLRLESTHEHGTTFHAVLPNKKLMPNKERSAQNVNHELQP